MHCEKKTSWRMECDALSNAPLGNVVGLKDLTDLFTFRNLLVLFFVAAKSPIPYLSLFTIMFLIYCCLKDFSEHT